MFILLILSLLKIFQVLLFRAGTHMKKHQYPAYNGCQCVFNLCINNVFFATVKQISNVGTSVVEKYGTSMSYDAMFVPLVIHCYFYDQMNKT